MGMTLLQNDMVHISDSPTLQTNTKGEKYQLKLKLPDILQQE